MRKLSIATLVAAGAIIASSPALAVTVDFVGPGSTYSGGGGTGTVAAGGQTNFLFDTSHFVTSPVFTAIGLTSASSYSFTAALAYSGSAGLTETEFFNIFLNNIQIGSFTVAAGTGTTSISGSGTFAAINTSAGAQISYRVAQNVTSGAGSVSFFDLGSAFVLTGATAAVPEPASWALMIAGFGMVGATMRRRQKVRTAARFA